MASELRVNTLKDASGNNSVATSTIAEGTGKAWHRANATGTTLNDSHNVSSLGDQGTGQQVINLTSSMNDTNYAGFQGMWVHNRSEPFLYDQATGSYKSYIYDEGNTSYQDTAQNSMVVGDLA